MIDILLAMKNLIIRLPEDLHRALKIKCAENNTSIQKLVEDFIRGYAGTNTKPTKKGKR